MASPLRAKALAAKDIKSELLTVPQWDCTFTIRGLSAAERVSLVKRSSVKQKDENGDEIEVIDNATLNPLLVVASCYDPDTNERVFEETDADALNQKSAEAMDIVTQAVLRINGMSKAENTALEKNSGATATGAGASA